MQTNVTPNYLIIDNYLLQFQVAATQTIMLHLLSGRKTKPQHQILLGHSGRVNCLSYPNNDHPRYDVAHLVSGYVQGVPLIC